MIVVSMLLHAEMGRNDHQEGAPHFIYFCQYSSFEMEKNVRRFESQDSGFFENSNFLFLEIRFLIRQ